MKKFISLGVVAMAILSSNALIYGTQNAELVVESTNDVSYSDSVNYMIDNGFMGGYADGTLKLENNLSINEFAALAVRAGQFEDFVYSAEGGWSKAYLDFINKNEWLRYYEVNRCDVSLCNEFITREIAIKGLLNMYGLTDYIYVPYFYDLGIADLHDCKLIDNESYMNTACLLGLIEKDEDGKVNPQSYVTRGEFCDWVYKLKTIKEEELNKLVPEILGKVNIKYMDNQGKSAIRTVENGIGEIPEFIVNKFVEKGWKINISDKDIYQILDYPGMDLSMAKGLCDYNSKNIYVTTSMFGGTASTLQHEMGHFVEKAYFSDSQSQAEIQKLYDAQAEALSKFVGRSYCKTSKQEFFAEAFYAYVAWTTGTGRMFESIHTELPEICEFFDNFCQKNEVNIVK